jgi:hypothetical protein
MAGTAHAGTSQTDGGESAKDFAGAFLTGAVRWPSVPTADPSAATAFELGWLICTLKKSTDGTSTNLQAILLDGPDTVSAGAGAGEIDLEGMLRLRIRALTRRIQVRLKTKGESEEDIGRLESAEDVDASARHKQTFEALHVLDASLADAYVLGWNMRALYPDPPQEVEGKEISDVKQAVSKNALALDDALGRLASKLPPNAAHSVRHSLALWQTQLDSMNDEVVVQRFGEQIQRWRSMLKGDVAAKDLLRASDYVGTVEGVIDRLGDVARASIRRTAVKILAGVVMLLLFVTIVLFVLDQNDATLAGVGTLLAALGLSWKGTGEFFGRAAAMGEKALWDAQLNWTIAYRCTLLPTDDLSPMPDENIKATSPGLAEHVEEWKQWQKRWPDLETDAARDGSR